MKRNKRRNSLRLSLLFITCAIYSACNVPEPGCLDIEAENFDFEAERNDVSLCVYPNLVLNVLYQWADSSLRTNYLYRNASGMDYAIHGVQILFSGFVVKNRAGEDLVVDDRVTIKAGSCASGSESEVADDFLFADRSTFNYVIGAFRGSGLMNQFRVSVGVPDAYTPMCLESLPLNHILTGIRTAYDTIKGDFALGRFIVSRDSINAARDTFYAYGISEELQFDVARTFTQGKKDTLYMAIDFHQIFDPVNLNQPKDAIANELAVRISESIRLE